MSNSQIPPAERRSVFATRRLLAASAACRRSRLSAARRPLAASVAVDGGDS